MNDYQPLRIKHYSFLQRHGSLLLFLVAMATLGFLAQFQWMGYLIILGYIVTAVIRRIPAHTTFVIALLTLGMVPIAIIVANWTIAQNFAAYCFVLLIFGVILTTAELRGEPRSST